MMKRILLTIAAMMPFLSAWCQTDEFTRQQADKLDSVTVKLMNQKRYEDAIKTKERELAILKALYGEKDTTSSSLLSVPNCITGTNSRIWPQR